MGPYSGLTLRCGLASFDLSRGKVCSSGGIFKLNTIDIALHCTGLKVHHTAKVSILVRPASMFILS